jgi:hypothetical protein
LHFKTFDLSECFGLWLTIEARLAKNDKLKHIGHKAGGVASKLPFARKQFFHTL